MSDEIKLPPFVAQSLPFGGYTYEDIVKYARAAIEVDRKGRVPMTNEQIADECEAWLQASGASNIVDAYEAGYRQAERKHGIRPAGGEHG